MKTFFFTFILSLGASLVLNWVFRWVGLKLKIHDVAWGRKIHSGNIPRTGGLAIAISLFLPVYALLFYDNRIAEVWRNNSDHALAILIGGLLSVALGFRDDLKRLRARYKLLGQIAIATIVYFMGIRIEFIVLPFIGSLTMGDFALPVTVFWIISFMNAVNLIDGVDGLCGGIVFIASLAVFFLAVSFNSVLVALFAAAIAGSVLGFLRYNFHPASIFMGDSGTYFLGFILATASIIGSQKTSVAVAVLAPMLALGLPFIDTFLAITRRISRGLPISSPDRGHLHHRLLDKGFSVRKVAGIFYAFSALLAVGGVLVVTRKNWEAGMALVVSIIVIFFLMRLAGFHILRQIRGDPRAIGVNGRPEEFRSSYSVVKADQLKERLPEFIAGALKAEGLERLTELLKDLAEKAEFDRMELLLEGKGESGEPFKWTYEKPGDKIESGDIHRLKAVYPLMKGGKQVGIWTLEWSSELDRITPETDALLELTGSVMCNGEQY